MSVISTLLLLLGGILAGTFGALLGIGGGALLIPFLVLVLDIPMHQAIATSIIAVIATSSTGAAMNLEKQVVHIRLGMVLEITTVTGAVFGGITANYLDAGILTKLFSGLLFFVGCIMMWNMKRRKGNEPVSLDGILPAQYTDYSTHAVIPYSVKNLPATLAVSLVAGNISGLLGVGGGLFKVPAMHILSGVPMKAATATSNFMIGVTAAASAFIYFAHGHLNPIIASTAVLGVLIGSMAGIFLSRRIRSTALSWIFIIVLFGISIRLMLK